MSAAAAAAGEGSVSVLSALCGDSGGGSSGNPAGVVLLTAPMPSLHSAALPPAVAAALGTDAARTAVAAAVGAPETVFIEALEAPTAAFSPVHLHSMCCSSLCCRAISRLTSTCFLSLVAVTYFSSEGPVDVCGHATIAALHFVAQRTGPGRRSFVLHTRAGTLQACVDEDGTAWMEQLALSDCTPVDVHAVMQCLPGTPVDAVAVDWAPRIASTGLRALFLQLQSPAAVAALAPDMARLSALSRSLDVVGLHAWALKPQRPCDGGTPADSAPREAVARFFAPVLNVDEEAATGTANGVLTALLCKGDDDVLRVQQGLPGTPPSLVLGRVNAATGTPTVGGAAAASKTGVLKSLPGGLWAVCWHPPVSGGDGDVAAVPRLPRGWTLLRTSAHAAAGVGAGAGAGTGAGTGAGAGDAPTTSLFARVMRLQPQPSPGGAGDLVADLTGVKLSSNIKLLSWCFDADGLRAIQACPTPEAVMSLLGTTPAWLEKKLTDGWQFVLATFRLPAAEAHTATWDGVLDTVHRHFPSVVQHVAAHWDAVRTTPFLELQRAAGFSLLEADLAGPTHPHYWTTARLAAVPVADTHPWMVRAFLYMALGLSEFFLGTGCTEGGGLQEYLVPNLPLLDMAGLQVEVLGLGNAPRWRVV